MPPFPPCDWNEGHVAKDDTTGKPVFTRAVRRGDLAGVQNAWHPVKVDHLEFEPVQGGGRRIGQYVHLVTYPTLSGDEQSTILSKCTEFPWQTPCLESETTAYEWIQGTDVGPEFLGHVTEDGRVIGFVLEYIENTRAADPDDLPACQKALAKLHSLGVHHGDINRYNFMIRKHDVPAVLIDFEAAHKDTSADKLATESALLESKLKDESGLGRSARLG